MIVTELYNGQGLGNQLWCYVMTRVIALDKGYDFGIQSPERFKAYDFMDIDFGLPVIGGSGPESGPPLTLPTGINHYYLERGIFHPSGADLRTLDDQLVSIPDDTKIDGYMQDVQYIEKHKNKIKEWLKVRPEKESYEFSGDSICVINFRGGMYVYDKDFFLQESYWKDAVANMQKINKNFRFIVITDDVTTAKKFFPEYDVFHFSISRDYVTIKNAKYLILSNSSFALFPAWLNENLKFCIAPKYWGRYNTSDGFWSMGYNIVDEWHYQDKNGNLEDGKACREEFDRYLAEHKDVLTNVRKFDAHDTYQPKTEAAVRQKTNIVVELSNRLRNIPILFKVNWKNKSMTSAIVETISVVSSKMVSYARDHVKRAIKKGDNAETRMNLARVSRAWTVWCLRKTVTLTGIPSLAKSIKERRVKKSWLSPSEIAAYRKTIKIYDVFCFFNELDLLEIRLNILDPYVDHFVIYEASRTFSGDPKPLYFQENRHRFKKWEHKIIHYVVDNVPKNEDDLQGRLYANKDLDIINREIIVNSLTSDLVTRNDQEWFHWAREFYIKESVIKALTNIGDEDICYVSDLDEIWNPEITIDYSKDDIFKPMQVGYQYYFNNRSDEDPWFGWSGTIVTKFKNIKALGINHVRSHPKMGRASYTFLKNGGWHFGFMGGYEGARRKIEESNHFYYNTKEALSELQNMISKNKDHRKRGIKLWKDERGLPQYILDNREKYKKIFL